MKLADWLKTNGKTATWLATQVGRDPSFITRVKNGDAMPSIEVAIDIHEATGGQVGLRDWSKREWADTPDQPSSEIPASTACPEPEGFSLSQRAQ